jgi:asparagine synthase (glutamine-hydrolysing)
MIHSLESRTPLADVRVAEFAATLPWTMNLRMNGNGQWTGKHLLKQIVAKYFNQEFVERRKAGFVVPLKNWFAPDGALRLELKDRFCVGNARIYRYFLPEVVRRLVELAQRLRTRQFSATLAAAAFRELARARPGFDTP